jgi:hypothetical protein
MKSDSISPGIFVPCSSSSSFLSLAGVTKCLDVSDIVTEKITKTVNDQIMDFLETANCIKIIIVRYSKYACNYYFLGSKDFITMEVL